MLAEVKAAIAELPDGNPASPHAEGRAARAALDRARDLAAAALGVDSAELVFTSSGTEAVNLALLGAGRLLPKGATVATWAAEHHAVLGALRRLQLEGARLEVLPVDSLGRNAGDVPDSARLVSTSVANNEIGTIQPLVAAPPDAVVHLDACQGPRWLDLDLVGFDLVSFSGLKIGAGEGGLLCVRSSRRVEPLTYGGPQERGRRAGPEPVRAATAVAVALDACRRRRSAAAARAARLVERLWATVISAGGRPTGDRQNRLPNHVSAVFPGIRGEDLVMALDLAGIATSAGSACASGALDPSHVLIAVGYDLDGAQSGLRLTVGWDTTEAEVDRAAEVLAATVKRFTRVPA